MPLSASLPPASLLDWLQPVYVLTYLLVMVRLTGMMLAAPFFTQAAFPMRVKVGFALGVGLLLFTSVGLPYATQNPTLAGADKGLPTFLAMALQELALGLMLGLVVRLAVEAVQMAGELLSVQMGMAMASQVDPSSGAPQPLIGKLLLYMALVLLLQYNLHHALIEAVVASYTPMPLGAPWPWDNTGVLVNRMVTLGSQMFVAALMLAMPVKALLLMLEVAMAFVAKLMPQMNIFMVALPLKLVVGFWGLATFLPMAAQWLEGYYDTVWTVLTRLYVGLL